MVNTNSNWLLFSLTLFMVLLPICRPRAVTGTNRSVRMVRDVYPEELVTEKSTNGGSQVKVCIVGDVVYEGGETVASSDPCQRCECQPPGVKCQSVICPPPQPGCRVLHRPDQCCPQYQCECTHEGQKYANGERVNNTSEGPCRVCYCRGGLIQCADVGCYKRDDCEPVNVPGQCCPRYDHCPPKDNILDGPHLTMDDAPVISNKNSDSENDELSAENIVIKNVPQVNDADLEESSGNGEDGTRIGEEFLDVFSSTKSPVHKNLDSPPEESYKSAISDISFPQITIKEILPERIDIPLIAPPKREVNFKISSVEHNSSKLELENDSIDSSEESKEKGPIEELSTINISDTNLDSSNEVENEDINKHPTDLNEPYSPSVLRIGDQLFVLKPGALGKDVNKSSVITVIGAEGLHVIPEFEGQNSDINETSESRVSILTNSNENDENDKSTPSDLQIDSSDNFDVSSGFGPESVLIKLEDPPFTDGLIGEKLPSTVNSIQLSTQIPTDNIVTDGPEQDSKNTTEELNETNEAYITTSGSNVYDSSKGLTTDIIDGIDQMTEDHIDLLSEHNPEYPPLPEDIGISHRLEDTSFTDIFENSETNNVKHSVSTETDNQPSSTYTNNFSTTTEIPQESILNLSAALPSDILEQHAISDDYVNDEETDLMLKKNVKYASTPETIDNENKTSSNDESSSPTTVDNTKESISTEGNILHNETVTEMAILEPADINEEPGLIAQDNLDILAESSLIHEDKMLNDMSKDTDSHQVNTVVKKNLSGMENNPYSTTDTNMTEHYKEVEVINPQEDKITIADTAETVEILTESGEHVTEENQHNSLLSNEDASIEMIQDNSSGNKDDFEMIMPSLVAQDSIDIKNYGVDPIDTILINKSTEKNLEDVEFIQINNTQDLIQASNKSHEDFKLDDEKIQRNEITSDPDLDASTESTKSEYDSSTQDVKGSAVDEVSQLKYHTALDGGVLSVIRNFFQNQYRETE